MTQTQRITNRIYDKHLLTITPLEVVLLAELSDQIADYPNTHALEEGPNVSTRMDWDKMATDVMTWLGLNALCAGVIVCLGWLGIEAFHALAELARVIVRLI